MRKGTFRPIAILASMVLLAAVPMSAQANHSWGTYHWARTSNPVSIQVVDSMTADWTWKLDAAISDWNKAGPAPTAPKSTVLNIVKESGDKSSTARKRCSAISGKVRSCNATYGSNGWLGLAQIWISGGHITQAVAKMNDTYLATTRYGDIADRHVICQEIGHDWGLGHQDESGADLDTCMDYSRGLDNPSPNQHDYDQLVAIYGGHVESGSGSKTMPKGFLKADMRAQENWGTKVHESAQGAIFVRGFGGGNKVLTHVTWAQ
jgi:hypothetical protein